MSVNVSSAPLVRQRRSRLAILLSWVVILGLAGRIVYINAQAGESPSVQRLMNDERARMFGMLAVQMMSLQKDSAPGSAAVRERLGGLIEQLEEDARTAEDRIRIAILTGESLGVDAGLQKLSSITETPVNDAAIQDIRSVRTIFTAGVATGLSASDREGLMTRHGYLGRLALAHGVPPDREPRKTLQLEAFWFAVRLSVVGVGLMVMMAGSVAAFVFVCVWLARGRLKAAYAASASDGGAFLEGFALYLVLFVGLGIGLRYVGPGSLQWNWLALLILPIVWIWTTLRGTTLEERRQAFGWTRGRGFLREIGAGVGGYLAGLVLIAIGCLITLLLVRITGAHASSPIVQELSGGPWRLAGLYAMACIFAPFMEETMFRGILFHHLRQRWSWVVTAGIVSVIFAMLHPQGWVAVPALTAIAMVLSALREWRGSLIAPMAAHACNNFLVLTLALLFLR